jgi:outer membrane protein TolC
MALVPAHASAQVMPTPPQEEGRALSLSEALRTALDQNRDLREARFALDEAEGLMSEARGSVLPQVDLTGSFSRNITPPAAFMPAIFFDPDAEPGELARVVFGADNVWSTTISMEQPLLDGRAFIAVGAAGRYRAVQEEMLRGRVFEVATRVRILYYELLLAQEQARLIERSVDRVVQSLDEARAMNDAGITSDYDVLRLEVELANLEPQLRRVLNQARARERDMVTELDLEEGTRLRLAGDLAQLNPDDPAANDAENQALLELTGVTPDELDDEAAADALFQRALEGSPALLQLDQNEKLRTAELRAEQADYLPRVSLFGNYQIQAQQDGRPDFFGDTGQRGYGRIVGIQVTAPLFTGFQRNARMDQKRAVLRQVRTQRDVTADRTRDQVRTLLEEVDEARLRSRGQRLAVVQARRGFDIASSQYREGLGSQLELTDAEVALRQSEFNYAEAVFDYLSSRARLDELVGQVPLPEGTWGHR